MMTIGKMLAILIGIFGVLALLLSLQNVAAGEWTTIAVDITPLFLMIAFFSIVFAAIIYYVRL